jgi:hypothetical protein
VPRELPEHRLYSYRLYDYRVYDRIQPQARRSRH